MPEVGVDTEILWETADADPLNDSTFYAWIAGEAAIVRELRRYLVQGLGIESKTSPFKGYRRRGKAESV